MMMVRAIASGVWRTVPQNPPREWEKSLVVVTPNIEPNPKWKVNTRAVAVFPGLILSFIEPLDMKHFLDTRRVAQLIVERGEPLLFEDDNDANYFVAQGLAQKMTEAEVQAVWDATKAAAEAAKADAEQAEQDDIEKAALALAGKVSRSRANGKRKTANV